MISTLFQNGQRIILQVLAWAQSAWQTTFANRIEDYSQAGIVHGELTEFTISAGSNNTPTTPSVTIGAGIAYDSIGNRTVISSTDTTSYNPTNPLQTTDDGTGNLIPTPQSTGCVNVSLTQNTVNYLWIDYLGIVSNTQFTLQDFTLAKQFYQQSDGYMLSVTTINTRPTANSVFLGSVNLSSGGVVSGTTISQVGRVYSANLPYRTLIQTPATNLSDRTTAYTLGNTYFADDHTKAVGTGTVTPTNPHGTSPLDIGLSGSSTIQFHQEFLHSAGLVGNTDNLAAAIVSVIPGFDRLVVNPIGPNEVLTSNGVSLTNADIPSATTLQFTSSDAQGTWFIYVDIINKIVSRTLTDLVTFPNPNQYVIYTVFYTFPDPNISNGHLSALTDMRVFGNIATREIQNGAVTGPKIATAVAGAGLSKDGSQNLQVNVDGTTVTINGSNQLTAHSIGLAGNGLISTGTTLSVNPDNSSINIISNQVEVATNGITPIKLSTSVAGSGLTGGGGAPLSITDGAITTRQAFPVSVVGASLTHVWQPVGTVTYSFTIPATTQPVVVGWSCNLSATSSQGNIGYGIAIDGKVLMTIMNSPFPLLMPPSYVSGGTTATPVSTVPTVYIPAMELAAGAHTLQFLLKGGGTSGSDFTCTGNIYLYWSVK